MDYNWAISFQVSLPFCPEKLLKTNNKLIIICSPLDNSLEIFVSLSFEDFFFYERSYLVMIFSLQFREFGVALFRHFAKHF